MKFFLFPFDVRCPRITVFSDFPVVSRHPVLRNRRWAVAPRVDHDVGREVGDGVRPAAREVQDLPWGHHEAHGRRVRIEGVLPQVGVHCKGVQGCAPLQRTLRAGVVEVLVVAGWENGPALFADDLVDEVVLAVNVTLSEGTW